MPIPLSSHVVVNTKSIARQLYAIFRSSREVLFLGPLPDAMYHYLLLEVEWELQVLFDKAEAPDEEVLLDMQGGLSVGRVKAERRPLKKPKGVVGDERGVEQALCGVDPVCAKARRARSISALRARASLISASRSSIYAAGSASTGNILKVVREVSCEL